MNQLNHLYYYLKPLIPRRLQIALRIKYVQLKRRAYSDVWPIDERAADAPGGWAGWPEGKKFAFVLTHDVESAMGQERCYKLADLEKELGFHSAFNFVPEKYEVSAGLRKYLTDNGFEVGVHGLYHDGKLHRSRKIFKERAAKINRYIKEWDAKGFRSPSMHNNLEWLHDLDIEYDSSTFDTDPFEPQSDGTRSIFPLWVSNGFNGKGYVELPYTLPQDFTLFVLMDEKTIDIWKHKLDWIAKHGGMALLNTHPDYMNFNGEKLDFEEYPEQHYKEFLEYIKSKYEGQYWQVLPKDIARFWAMIVSKLNTSAISFPYQREEVYVSPFEKETNYIPPFKKGGILAPTLPREMVIVSGKKKIWIDLDNSPHVVFFRPIIEELQKLGNKVVLTARNCFQVCGLADNFNLQYKLIGRHYGKNKVLKIAGTLFRSFELIPFALKNKPVIALSHGSRAQVIASKLLGIPSVVIFDYEYTKGFKDFKVFRPTWLMAPDLLFDYGYKKEKNNFGYPGIKEDVYASDFVPDPGILKDLGIRKKDLLVTIRPPATEAHYHNSESEVLFKELIEYLKQIKDIRLVVLPRNENQKREIQKMWLEMIENGSLLIPEKVVNGLNLIWYSDLVISGGGTMNREAAALGVPVYSIFRGKIGAVDRYLADSRRLTIIESVDDIHTKINVAKRDKSNTNNGNGKKSDVKASIINSIVSIIENGC